MSRKKPPVAAAPSPRASRPRLRIVLVAAVVLLLGGAAAYLAGSRLWASRQYDAAMQALDRYDYEEAAVHLEKYLSIHPTDPDALLLAAQTARRRGNLD